MGRGAKEEGLETKLWFEGPTGSQRGNPKRAILQFGIAWMVAPVLLFFNETLSKSTKDKKTTSLTITKGWYVNIRPVLLLHI
jgi:hypothetical protein